MPNTGHASDEPSDDFVDRADLEPYYDPYTDAFYRDDGSREDEYDDYDYLDAEMRYYAQLDAVGVDREPIESPDLEPKQPSQGSVMRHKRSWSLEDHYPAKRCRGHRHFWRMTTRANRNRGKAPYRIRGV